MWVVARLLAALLVVGASHCVFLDRGGTSTSTAGTTTSTAGTTTDTGGSSATPTGGTGGTGAGGGPVGGGATGGSGAGWQVIDAFDVPGTGATVQSVVVLEDGVTYRLRASGTLDCVGDGTVCDAEYVNRPPPDDLSGGIDFGVGIDDLVVDLDTPPAWGPYDPSHVYEVDWVGVGAVITALLHDPNYANNTGSLHLEILAFQ